METPSLPNSMCMTVSLPGTDQRPYVLTPFHPLALADREHLPEALLDVLEGMVPRNLIGGYQVTTGHELAGYLIEYLDSPVAGPVVAVWTPEHDIVARHVREQRLIGGVYELDARTRCPTDP